MRYKVGLRRRRVLAPLVPLLSVAVFAVFLVVPALASAQAEDITPPSLVEFSFAPDTIDTSGGDAVVTATLRITDAQSGFGSGGVSFLGPGGVQSRGAPIFPADRISGTINDGTYRVRVTFPQLSAFGVWKASVSLTDRLGNHEILSTAGLAALLFPTELTNGPVEQCGDGVDNDGDGFIDEAPPCAGLPPATSLTGAIGSDAGGVPLVLSCDTVTVTEQNSPPADSVEIVVKRDDGSIAASGPMTSADGVNWAFTFDTPCPGFGRLHIEKTVRRGAASQAEFGTLRLIDPSGVVFDEDTRRPIEGATVTLEVSDGSAFVPFDVVAHPSLASPAVNPQTTDADGRYGWLVVPGRYRVSVTKQGCAPAISREVTVPPPVTDLDVGLTCVRAVKLRIDIKPGSDPNSIKLSSKGVIPVAILTTADFDATTVDRASVCFGDAEAAGERDCTEAHGRGHLEDVDADGDLDHVLHFETAETGIDAGDREACLTGETFGGAPVEGCDSVRML